MKKAFIKISRFFNLLRIHWGIKYRLVIKNINTHEEKFSFLLSLRNIFVIVTIMIWLLIGLTTMLITVTPLRYYLPGNLGPEDYKKYQRVSSRVDSLDRILSRNTQFMDNLYAILNDIPVPKDAQTDIELSEADKDSTHSLSSQERELRQQATEQLLADADMILLKLSAKESPSTVLLPSSNRNVLQKMTLFAPADGIIISKFNPNDFKTGIGISCEQRSPVRSIADGIVLYVGFNPTDAHILIIQHHGGLVSTYKHVGKLLKTTGERVRASEPVAYTNEYKNTDIGAVFYFELWYNGIQINPVEYIPMSK
jgi:murein DD-endopeptidase MepM/ murein hydrolase activator NlpD